MFCTQCGLDMQEGARFCSACGNPTPLARPVEDSRPLALDKRNKKIAGVCAGFARYLQTDVTLIRVLWLLVVFVGGAGILGYIAAWIVMPSDHGAGPAKA